MPGEPDAIKVAATPAEIGLPNAAEVRAVLTRPLAAGITVLVADMTATTWCTLEGLQTLLQARAAAAAAGPWQQALARGPPPVW